MKMEATIRPFGVEFTLTAESDYEHAMLKLLASGAYDVRGVFCEGQDSWYPTRPTTGTIHLTRPKPDQPSGDQQP